MLIITSTMQQNISFSLLNSFIVHQNLVNNIYAVTYCTLNPINYYQYNKIIKIPKLPFNKLKSVFMSFCPLIDDKSHNMIKVNP